MLTIDTRQGTASHPDFSHGNTLPLTGVPFGMHYLTVQTNGDRGSWFFDPASHQYEGIRLTHQPSPWIGDFQHWTLRGVPANAADPLSPSAYDPARAIFSPALIDLTDTRYGIRTQATMAARAGMAVVDGSSDSPLALHITAPQRWQIVTRTAAGFIFQTQNQSESRDPDFAMTTAVSVDNAIDWDNARILTEAGSQSVDSAVPAGGTLILPLTKASATVRFAASFISPAAAQRLLATVSQQSFSALHATNEAAWAEKLALIQARDSRPARVQTLMTNWYRSLLFPMRFYERDEKGAPIHYNTTARKVFPGKLFTNTGFWDTYKTNFPLYALLMPEQYGDFLEGFLNSAKETGYLPKWLSPDERGTMPGTMADAVVADAVTKGIRPDLWEDLLAAMVHGATTESPDPRYGRANLKDYRALGYVPADIPESVNQTLDYAYSDALIGVVADALGHTAMAKQYTAYGKNYKHLFDPQFNLMHPKDRDGHFTPDFDPLTWGTGFTEGGAWQNSFAVYQDMAGLIKLAGGPQAFLHTLHTLANTDPAFNVGTYGGVIHEMTEMNALNFGQIAMSNQPSFHVPYLYALAGEPSATQLLVKQLMLHAFHAGPDGYPGDEDNGSMSSWYIWSALGLYPLRPGFGDYVLGIPFFDEVTLQLPDHTLTLTTQNNTDQMLFVQKRTANGQPLSGNTITNKQLTALRTLVSKLQLLPSL